jgi:hypothetical protein
MKPFFVLFGCAIVLSFLGGCTTTHFRSKQSIPLSYDGNPQHQKEVFVQGKVNFMWWGTEPEHQVVYIDKELQKAGIDSLSKMIIYEPKTPQDILISFLTLGVYMPRRWAIMGYTAEEGMMAKHDSNINRAPSIIEDNLIQKSSARARTQTSVNSKTTQKDAKSNDFEKDMSEGEMDEFFDDLDQQNQKSLKQKN